MTKIRSTDASRMDDARGMGGGMGGGLGGMFGGGGFPFPLPVGGGLVGVIVLLASLVLPRLMHSTTTNQVTGNTGGSACATALGQVVCGVTNDVQDFWNAELPQAYGVQYQYTKTRLFDQPMASGCGTASPETGPFYCPVDRLVYIDLGFMQQLEQQFVGTTSDLAEQYIVAHEYGHHVQNLLGINDRVQQAAAADPGKANEYSQALELQADCYAGVWVGDANRRGLLDSPTEIQEAIKAAEGVGDDRIQQATTGRINPEKWTHGSAAERHQWFMTGYTTIDPKACTTVDAVLPG